MPVKDFTIFIISVAVIVKSADFFTDGASGVARAFRIPQLVIGLTIVSLATSAPELTVSVIASHIGVGGLSVGNALGSCIANIGLVLGLAALFKPIRFQPRLMNLELRFLAGISVLIFLLMLNFRNGLPGIFQEGLLSIWDGIFLNLLLVFACVYLVKRELKVRGTKKLDSDSSTDDSSPGVVKKNILKFLIGAIGVVVSAKYGIVPSGQNIARFFNVPEIVIGLSMVAIGTSLPELVTALVAVSKRMGDMAAGTVIGSNIVNLLCVLGAATFFNPLIIDKQTILLNMPVTLLFTFIMIIFGRTGFRLVRWEGASLFILYLAYMVYLFKFAY